MSPRETDPHDAQSHMECSQALYRMMQYVDGELTRADAEQIAAHLQTCGPCLDEHDVDLLVKQLVHRSCQEGPAPAHLRTTIMRSITTYGCDGSYTEVRRSSVRYTQD